jgi:hypothetical protein
MASGNKIPKITDFDTLEAYVNATLAADGPPKSMGRAGPGMMQKPKKGQKMFPDMRKGLKNPQRGRNNG